MEGLLILIVMLNGALSVGVTYVSEAPKIDGVVDSVWSIADSITEFRQFEPYYGHEPSYRTVVKFLQDDTNLYALFICYTGDDSPTVTMSAREDRVKLYLDTFNSMTNAYKFSVSASNFRYDELITDDGRRKASWDGIWYSAVKVYPHKWVAELKIPFRSIRHKSGLHEWGLQLERYIAKNNETDYWVLPDEVAELRVSEFGRLVGVKPKVSGHGAEFYPVALVRYDYYSGEASTRPKAGVNFSLIRSDFMFNFTAYPDFAQIEADPFALNLSKFERWLHERRPFFVEATEVFSPARMGHGMGFYRPITVFYSRRIGRRLSDGTEVPIIFGAKMTSKSSKFEFGTATILTDDVDYSYGTEPAAVWNVLRIKKRFWTNSEIGMLYAGKSLGKEPSEWGFAENYHSFDIDGAFRHGNSQLLYQVVFTRTPEAKSGMAFTTGGLYLAEDWMLMASYKALNKEFDNTATGYLADLPGSESFVLGGGPIFKFHEGKVRHIFSTFGFGRGHEPEEPYVNTFFTSIYLSMRDGSGLSVNTEYARDYEFGQWFDNYRLGVNYWKGSGRITYGFWSNFSHRWDYIDTVLTWISLNGLWIDIPVTNRFEVGLNTNNWTVFNPDKSLKYITLRVNPWMTYFISPTMRINSSLEPVFNISDDGREMELMRVGFRFEYEFLPKSKFYIVLNTLYERGNGKLTVSEQVAAIKVKWAIPF